MTALRALLLLGLVLIAGTSGFIFHKSQLEVPKAMGDVPRAVEDPPENILDWIFLDVSGREYAIREWSNGLLVINFWATWCPPCLTEIPGFVRIQELFKMQGVQFVGIALDSAMAVTDYSESNDMNYPLLLGEDSVIRFMGVLGNDIGALPYTVIMSGNGDILHSHKGEWSESAARATIEKLLPITSN